MTDRQIPPAPQLVRDVDYYWEGGRMVFTAHFLRRRGYCCGSGCRHCPYEDGETQTDAAETWQSTESS